VRVVGLNSTGRRLLSLATLSLLCSVASAQQWTAPTDEELKMTSQPEVPGAAAVYLYREQTSDDSVNVMTFYVRLKVLNEHGKEFGTVEIKRFQTSDYGGFRVTDVQGRTIHPDGVSIPFTGKPSEKLIEKGHDYKEMADVFTLPDVQVGSILEYRYKLQFDFAVIPDWYVQSELFTRNAHFLWHRTNPNPIQATAILPPPAAVKRTFDASHSLQLELNIQNVPPTPDEEFMPPIKSMSYRVLFYSSTFPTPDEFWKEEGKIWAKGRDEFIGPGSKIKKALPQLVDVSDTQDQKLRKIYAAVMRLDNSSFDRKISAREAKAHGFDKVHSAEDVWEKGRGTDDQIADLFVAFARAAGMKAYVMTVTDRDRNLFLLKYPRFSQLDDDIAIVVVDGKEQFFDPGQRYCPYGHLAWKHTLSEGIREVEGGSAIAGTPGELYDVSKTQRIADLTVDEHGEATGSVTMTWTGAPALYWRQGSLRNDFAGLRGDLHTAMERMLSAGLEIEVGSIEGLQDYEKPLSVTFWVKGGVGSSTGKRMLLPGDVFVTNEKAIFPHEKRNLPVYFQYPSLVQDVTRIKFPAGFGVESLPSKVTLPYAKSAFYSLEAEVNSTSVTVKRQMGIGNVVFPTTEYADLRSFYGTLETKDQEPVVLKLAAAAGGN
jgi:hypothetical protein